jgi:hypothetical protein
MLVCFECLVLSGRGLCDGLITRPEKSYRLWRVVVCDQETSKNEEAKARYRVVENTTTLGCNAKKTNKQAREGSLHFTLRFEVPINKSNDLLSLVSLCRRSVGFVYLTEYIYGL